MKILELGKFYPPHQGGIETLLRSLSKGFVELGADLDCVVANDVARTQREVIEGVRVHRLASYGLAFSTSLCPSYLRAPRRFPADLWHMHFPNPLADLACLAGAKRTPLVLSYHSDVIRQANLLRLYGPILRRILDRATRIVVATPKHIEHSAWLGAYQEKCEVIPYGINQERFAMTPALAARVAELRAEAGGRRILLNVGRLVGYKGQRYLIDAARELDAVVWIVGTGPLEAELKQQARDLGLADRVRFWGGVDDTGLPALFHACDVFLLPSITPNEAFGLVQVEAMACGKPVISCSLASGVPFVNLHERTGLVVPPCDADALVRAVRRLLEDAPLREQYGAAALRRAREEFDEPVMVRRYWECFERLLGAGTQR